MHLDAVARLHGAYGDRIQHLQANALETDLPGESADLVISTFGLKTFNSDQLARLAKQIARLLRPGGSFSLIEASDPVGWWGRPLYRLYLDRVLPWVERLFLTGAQDFTMIGPYSKRVGTAAGMAQALQAQGLDVVLRNHVFGCATSVAGTKPMSREPTDLSPCPPTP
ncbi:class I SAM-dependent methyltransferase [Rhodophyticola porphyridii]|uniref:class I SAM-dependent methyltransferase n=1 Tax=Rhodophyticola porphyridii TaxID=1852017 RepID=UPI002279450D|nr:class I SAM-dependent methyltransferase [Rhodophyticola porphyridii]